LLLNHSLWVLTLTHQIPIALVGRFILLQRKQSD
jgi:hypothetical protein